MLDQSPFYGEAGGQVGDTGRIQSEDAVFEVTDTQRDGDLILHHGRLAEGSLAAGDRVEARVDRDRRAAIRRAHTATHILHYALQKHLGTHAQQQGSKVDRDWLRFDFTNLAPINAEQLAAVEAEVHQRIADRDNVECRVVPLAHARDQGAMMLFGEKYPDPVRMVCMGSFSRELCGGTHLGNTRDVGSFEIVAEEAVAAGTRRVTALTGNRADAHQQEIRSSLIDVARRLGVDPLAVPDDVQRLTQHLRNLRKCLAGGGQPPEPFPQRDQAHANLHDQPFAQLREALKEAARMLNVGTKDVAQRVTRLLQEVRQSEQQLQTRDAHAMLSADQLLDSAETVRGATVVVAETPGITPALMRRLIDEMRRKGRPVAALLASAQEDDKISFVAGISDELQDRGARADRWVREVAQTVGGGGGGRPDMAQAGGKSVKDLPEALKTARQSIASMLDAD